MSMIKIHFMGLYIKINTDICDHKGAIKYYSIRTKTAEPSSIYLALNVSRTLDKVFMMIIWDNLLPFSSKICIVGTEQNCLG